MVAGIGENQDTEDKRLDSYKKRYMKGLPDLMVLDYHKDFKGLCIEFKSPTNINRVSEAQKDMKKWYVIMDMHISYQIIKEGTGRIRHLKSAILNYLNLFPFTPFAVH